MKIINEQKKATKNILRNLLLATLCIVILFLQSNFGFAALAVGSDLNYSESEFSFEKEYIQLQIEKNHGIHVTPTEAYYLLDTSGNNTYACVEFTGTDGTNGFGVVDLTDYTLIIYSLEKNPPFSKNDDVLCAGALDYAIIDSNSNTATIIDSGRTVAVEDLLDNTRESTAILDSSERAGLIESLDNELSSRRDTRSAGDIVVSGGSDTSLVYNAGSNSGSWTTNCGINAIAMYLRHMNNYFYSGYVSSAHNTESKLKIALAEIANKNWGITTGISMDRLATLANDYMKAYSSGYTTVKNSSYTWTKYSTRINNGNGKPCVLYIGAGATSYWTKAHAVIGVGYTSGATSTSGSLKVNSGWTSLGYVYIATSVPGNIIS